ncbi:MAG TPA: homocysteine S-methyltransferase family protein [Armatimonadota bacterium]|nr:homocysteine S-methyltransferase family protein [Armatimonadota bacterium]
MRGKSLIELAITHPVLCDGAMGTMLQAHGLPAGACPELWNVERPDAIAQIHAAYIEAGSRIISTNTFGANRLKLAPYGIAERARELNSAGVAIAREVAGPEIFVAGSIGPTGEFLEPLGNLSFGEAVEAFAEQAVAQAQAGADVILIETFSDLEEAKAALAGALSSGIPCFCTMAFDTGGRTMMGVDPVAAVVELTKAGASGVGANCGLGPTETLEIIRQMREASSGIVIAQPNAGLPRLVEGRTVYDSTPEEMASYAVEFARLGVNIIGACCGSTPEHIRAMAASLQKLQD